MQVDGYFVSLTELLPSEQLTDHYSFPAVNYEDPNLNIAIPVFSIHGNHDDPQGTGPVSVDDLNRNTDQHRKVLCVR